MATAQIRYRTKLYSPASATTDETAALFQVKKGERVVWASATVLTPATAGQVGTLTLGDGTDPDGFIQAFTPTAASAGTNTPLPTVANGAFLLVSGGRLYAADDTVDVVFDYTSGGVATLVVRFTIAVVREYPN